MSGALLALGSQPPPLGAYEPTLGHGWLPDQVKLMALGWKV